MTTVADGDQKLLTQPSNIAGPPSKALVAGDAISDSRNGINFLSTAARALTFLLDALAKVANLFTWPIALLVAVLLFLEPLQRVANILPQKLEQSNEFALSGLTFKIQEKARAQGNEELAKALSGLSREAMRELLRLGDDPSIVVQVVLGSSGKKKGYRLSSEFDAWRELEAKGLMKAKQDLTVFESQFRSLFEVNGLVAVDGLGTDLEKLILSNRVQLTDSGRQAYKLVLDVVLDMTTMGKAVAQTK